MTGTVHRLESELVFVDLELEHVFSIVLPVTRSLPKVGVKDVWRSDFGETTLEIFFLDKCHQGVVDSHTHGQEERTSGRKVVKDEQLLVLTDFSVVSLSGFLKILFVFFHLSIVGERHAVDSLESVVLGITKEVRRRVLVQYHQQMFNIQFALSHLGDGQGLNTASMRNMRTKTQVNQRATSVDSRRGSIRDLVLDIVLLILVVLEHLEQHLLG